MADVVDDILDASRLLLPKQRRHLIDTMDALAGLPASRDITNFEEKVADAYSHTCDVTKTVREADVGRPTVIRTLAEPAVQRVVNEKLRARAERSELKADYIRDYIYCLLELCPTDYFTQLPNGLWCVDPEDFKKVPQHIRRLVDSVELKRDARTGDIVLNVKFVSKSQALALAARYTLTEKHNVNVSTVPWEQIAKEAKAVVDDGNDPLERAIAEAGASGPT